MSKPEDEISGFYDDDGTKIDPNLMDKPSLCTTCKKDDVENEEMLCTMNKIDQQGEDEFVCEAYVSKFEVDTNENE
ncbi:MAG: hypothetical protein GY797_41215 [Deltaproteobacteria bacterium]|nr:hypothetical protein [Deltaproteobacteria bacterium]